MGYLTRVQVTRPVFFFFFFFDLDTGCYKNQGKLIVTTSRVETDVSDFQKAIWTTGKKKGIEEECCPNLVININ